MVILWFVDTRLRHGVCVPGQWLQLRSATLLLPAPPHAPGLASCFLPSFLGVVAVTYAWGLFCPLLVSSNPGHVFAKCPKKFHEFESITCFCPRLQLVNQGPSMFSQMARFPSFLGLNHILLSLNRLIDRYIDRERQNTTSLSMYLSIYLTLWLFPCRGYYK